MNAKDSVLNIVEFDLQTANQCFISSYYTVYIFFDEKGTNFIRIKIRRIT